MRFDIILNSMRAPVEFRPQVPYASSHTRPSSRVVVGVGVGAEDDLCVRELHDSSQHRGVPQAEEQGPGGSDPLDVLFVIDTFLGLMGKKKVH